MPSIMDSTIRCPTLIHRHGFEPKRLGSVCALRECGTPFTPLQVALGARLKTTAHDVRHPAQLIHATTPQLLELNHHCRLSLLSAHPPRPARRRPCALLPHLLSTYAGLPRHPPLARLAPAALPQLADLPGGHLRCGAYVGFPYGKVRYWLFGPENGIKVRSFVSISCL